MQCRWIVLAVWLIFTCRGWCQEPQGDCRHYFSRDDPALFEFVDTRKTVDFEQFAGLNIASIETVTLPVFNPDDPEENHWVYRLANRLHINTRASTLTRQLAVNVGQPLDPNTVRESERLLRDNKYLIDAMILPHRVCGNDIHLLVIARDVWTLSPSASASRSGGDNRSSLGLSESNLLGTGQTISIGHFNNSDRSGNRFNYLHPDFIGDHTRLDLGLENNSDGNGGDLSLSRPFYELDTRWAAGFAYSEIDQTETIEQNDQEINRYQSIKKNGSLFYGWSAGRQNGYVTRWRTGLSSSEELYETVNATVSSPPQDRVVRYPWLEWSSIQDSFVTLSNITHSHRNEDVLIGFRHTINIGYASESLDSSEDAWLFAANSEYTVSFGENHLLRLNLGADGRYYLDTKQPENTFYSGGAEYYNFPSGKRRLYASVQYIAGRNLNDDLELEAGGNDNLRGYPSDYQRGNRQWLATLEGRYFTDIHLFNLAYLGGAAYIDAGRTWDSTVHNPDSSHDTLADVGFGLRFSPSKFSVEKVLHVDIAVPLVNRDEVDSYQFIVSGKVDF